MSDDGFDLNATQITYFAQFLALRNEKVNALNFSKIIWTQYKDQIIDLKQARSLTCKINSSQLANEAYLRKIYAKLGLVATSIDVLVDCIKIAKNDNFSDQQKGQEITKKIVGNATATAVGMKSAKLLAKFIKICRKTNLVSIVAGFALDCILSYYLGKTTDDITEELLQKAFDYFNGK